MALARGASFLGETGAASDSLPSARRRLTLSRWMMDLGTGVAMGFGVLLGYFGPKGLRWVADWFMGKVK